MRIKNITTQNQLQLDDVEIKDPSTFDIFRKKIVISFVILLLFFAYSDKIWAQIEGLYNSSTEQFAGISTLMSATANNDIDGVRFFSKAGPSVINQRNKGGATSLHIACREGNFEIAKILIDNGANVNVVDNEGWSPLMRASLAGKEDIVEILLKGGAKAQLLNSLNESALVHATSAKCLGCINKIIENGNLIKTMDTLILKSQIADAFLVARSQENQQSQGVLESFLDYASKISPLVLKNSTIVEEEPLPLLSNQSKISNSKLNKFPKNYILKNQDNENLTAEQQNSYGVLEDPNLPAISKKNTIKESEIFEQNIPLNNEQYKPNSIQTKSPTKYKFRSSESKKSLPQEAPEIPNILTNNPPKEITKPNKKIKYSTIVNPQKQELPKQTEIKKFKFKIGQTSIKNNNIEPSEPKIKNLKNEIQIESTNKNDIIVDLKDQDQNQDYQEKPMSIQENQDDTIVLIEKKPNNSSNKKYKSTHSEDLIDQSIKSDLINSENKKVFKFKKNLNSESKNVQKDQDYQEKPMSIQENQDDTIVLIEKKPNNFSNKKYKSTHSEDLIDQSIKSDLINSENKKVFKFRKNLNSESKNVQIDDFNQDDNYPSSNASSSEKEAKNIKKFKLKKSVDDLEKYKVSDEQNEQNI
jgi:hypothetical protein